jgi:glycosyltransferase involved in cell wall biosynthesis
VRVDDGHDAGERITYLIASYNLGPYVGRCLASLRQQTNSNWRALIVDDASTDDSVAVITPFLEPGIRLLVNERNLGYVGTLRRLIAEASTDIVAVLDADDAVTPDATERLLAAYRANPDSGFVYSRFATYDSGLNTRVRVDGAAIPAGGTALRDGVIGAIRSFRRSVYARTAGLDESMRFAEDRDLVYKLEEVTRPVFIDAVLYHYRELPTSQSRHPEKREIGAINTRRARRAAIRRRGIRGPRRLVYATYFWSDYKAYSQRTPRVLRAIANGIARVAAGLCRAMGQPAETRNRSIASRTP